MNPTPQEIDAVIERMGREDRADILVTMHDVICYKEGIRKGIEIGKLIGAESESTTLARMQEDTSSNILFCEQWNVRARSIRAKLAEMLKGENE